MFQATFVTYINIRPQNASYIPKYSSSFPSRFATNILHSFLISPKPQLTTKFSRHILSSVFDLPFHIAAVFQERKCCVVFVGSRVNYLYIHLITNINTSHFSTHPHSGHAKCQHAKLSHKALTTVGQK